eukprot:COSAG01_NODE_45365_length_410_cov_0.585209_2_plen_26_part_01
MPEENAAAHPSQTERENAAMDAARLH